MVQPSAGVDGAGRQVVWPVGFRCQCTAKKGPMDRGKMPLGSVRRKNAGKGR